MFTFRELYLKNEAQNIILWGVSISPYVRKVMVALAEKKIVYEQKEILPKVLLAATEQAIPAEFEKASPLGKIPALQIDNYVIADSAAIAGYLDRKFSTGNKLYPDNPEEHGKALWFEHYSDTVLTSVAYQKIFLECVIKPKVLNQTTNSEIVDSAIANELPPLLDYLQKSISKNTWLAGSQFSMADVAVATQLLALEMAGFDLSDKRWNELTHYFRRVISRSSFKGMIA